MKNLATKAHVAGTLAGAMLLLVAGTAFAQTPSLITPFEIPSLPSLPSMGLPSLELPSLRTSVTPYRLPSVGNYRERYTQRYSSRPSSSLPRSTYDARSGNRYRTVSGSGSTTVYGSNSRTGSRWTTTIQSNGNMSGRDKSNNYWTYNSQSGYYHNFGTGKTCFGKGALRQCF